MKLTTGLYLCGTRKSPVDALDIHGCLQHQNRMQKAYIMKESLTYAAGTETFLFISLRPWLNYKVLPDKQLNFFCLTNVL